MLKINRKVTFPLFLVFLLGLSIPLVSGHDVNYSTSTYPFTIPTYGTAIGFSTNMVFDTAYRENDFWYFNTSTVSLKGFQVQDANITITDFFFSSSSILKFNVVASSGTSVSKVYVGNKGQPITVTGATSYSYESLNNITTVNVLHSSSAEIIFSWISGSSGTSSQRRTLLPEPPPRQITTSKNASFTEQWITRIEALGSAVTPSIASNILSIGFALLGLVLVYSGKEEGEKNVIVAGFVLIGLALLFFVLPNL